MKKQFPWIISLILLLLLIVSFVYFTNRRSIQEQKREAEVSFEKKTECAKYKDKITEEVNQYNRLQKPEHRDSDNTGSNPQINLYVEQKELKEIFYSPKENSCLYLVSLKTLFKLGEGANPDVGEWSIAYDTYYLIDALTSKEIDFNKGLPFLQIVNRGEAFNNPKEVVEIINEYK